ncbi:MAG: CehA/McbA family metallohydrolase [Clostridia bacterium]|nr:CehA/McbA family metallohydrolase [Clostridia bacterium]
MIVDEQGNKYYKLGLHIHTTISDGRKAPEDVAAEYKADGYDAIALTDHWKFGSSQELAGLKILSGCEYNMGAETISGVMHILGIGMKHDPQIPNTSTRQQVIDKIKEAGGIAVLAHPDWSLNTVRDAAELSGFAATEIYNAVSEAHQSLRAYSDYFVDVCANAGIYFNLFATDDAHYFDGSDNRKGWIMVKADELSDEALIEAIKKGDYYASQGPDLQVRFDGKVIVECSPCSIIGVLSNLAWTPDRVLRGEDLTHFEYTIKKNEKWVRVEVVNADGKRAWSNVVAL